LPLTCAKLATVLATLALPLIPGWQGWLVTLVAMLCTCAQCVLQHVDSTLSLREALEREEAAQGEALREVTRRRAMCVEMQAALDREHDHDEEVRRGTRVRGTRVRRSCFPQYTLTAAAPREGLRDGDRSNGSL
jgi:hypothetical protein